MDGAPGLVKAIKRVEGSARMCARLIPVDSDDLAELHAYGSWSNDVAVS